MFRKLIDPLFSVREFFRRGLEISQRFHESQLQLSYPGKIVSLCGGAGAV
jgi:hypothetical protein